MNNGHKGYKPITIMEQSRMVKLDPDCKYIILVPEEIPVGIAEEFSRELQSWLQSATQILVTYDNIRIQQIGKDGGGDCG